MYFDLFSPFMQSKFEVSVKFDQKNGFLGFNFPIFEFEFESQLYFWGFGHMKYTKDVKYRALQEAKNRIQKNQLEKKLFAKNYYVSIPEFEIDCNV